MKSVKRISFIYFNDWPNYQPLSQILIEIGLPFKEIYQFNLEVGFWAKNFPLPTILEDDEIIVYDGKIDSSGFSGCINMPNKQELETILKWLI